MPPCLPRAGHITADAPPSAQTCQDIPEDSENPLPRRPAACPDIANTAVKPIQKSNKLQNVCYDIRGPVLEKARQMEEEGHKIIKLNIGN